MKRQFVVSAATLVWLLAIHVGPVSAQYYPYPSMPGYSPQYQNNTGLSPYLNLLRGGDPAANYFLGTVPEFQRRSNFNYLQTKIQEIDQQSAATIGDLELAGRWTARGIRRRSITIRRIIRNRVGPAVRRRVSWGPTGRADRVPPLPV